LVSRYQKGRTILDFNEARDDGWQWHLVAEKCCVIFVRMISCGRDNIRLWRVKDGALRSAPVNLGDYHDSLEFTDCCFEAGLELTKDPLDRLV